MRYVLLPSVFLGPVVWEPVAEALAGDGAVRVADTAGATEPGQVLAAYVDAAAGLTDPVLVPHSNAGLYAPAVAAAVGAVATVYVDAALAATARPTPLAPEALVEHLATLVDDGGVLPPWTAWWDETDVAALFPDATTRRRVEAAEPRLPLSYLRGTVETPPGWESSPQAYLALGDTYAEELDRAAGLGWPTHRLEGGHLHPLHDPQATAGAVTALLRRILH